MNSSFKVYVDEAGDEGFQFLPNERGSSRWFVLSATVFRKSKDLFAVQTLKNARELLGKDPKKPLHFRHLKHEQRIPYIRLIGNSPVRTVSILIHKPSIKEPEKFQSEAYRLYRYATRLLLERTSWLCRDAHIEGEGDGTAEIIFSNRSAMSYENLKDYLLLLRQQAEASDVRIDWNVINPLTVRAVNHDQMAGLQIADAVASSVFYAAHLSQYRENEPRYLELLNRTFYRHKQTAIGYGLKFWPTEISALKETLEHLAIFERFK
jgi:hypothetical protein